MKEKELFTLNKLIHVANTVLELSKLAMYKFWYDFVKKKCKKCILLFTDTDSLCFETEEDFYEIMHKFHEFFDLSNFPKDSEYVRNDNKKVPGKMKDEYGGTAIYEFVRKNSKMYSVLDVNNCKKSVYKGHNSNIGHNEFLDVHSHKKVIRHNMKVIKSYKHKIYTSSIDKTFLSAFDDKIYIL